MDVLGHLIKHHVHDSYERESKVEIKYKGQEKNLRQEEELMWGITLPVNPEPTYDPKGDSESHAELWILD